MSTPIQPVVTPSPKPEWPELTAHIWYDDTPGREKYLFAVVPVKGSLATVTIPSSAECERRAKVEAAREKVLQAVSSMQLGTAYDALIQLRIIEQEAP